MKSVIPFGSWSSPVTAESLISKRIGLQQPRWSGDALYWIESRPQEKGRCVIVKWSPTSGAEDFIPPGPWNARNRIHEYGGGDFALGEGVLVFSNFSDQQLYLIADGEANSAPVALTSTDGLRFGGGVIDPLRNRWVGIREDHRAGEHEPINTLVAVSLGGSSEGVVLAEGSDFYACPQLSPDGRWMAWISWEHPSMPWDSTRLFVAPINPDGSLDEPVVVAGGPEESVLDPRWSPEGVLHFISDRSGWWNLYRCATPETFDAVSLFPATRDFGRPLWRLGGNNYDFISETELLCSYSREGVWVLARLDTSNATLRPLELPYAPTSFLDIGDGQAVMLGVSTTAPGAIVTLDLSSETLTVVKAAGPRELAPAWISEPEPIAFESTGGRTSHAFYYQPRNPDVEAPPEDLPPLLVWSHGGPTGAAGAAYRLGVQYWTSRGFGIVDVNYGGSTGFGRAYRDSLKGRWGEVDVDDCAAAALYLAREGRVDRNRLAIAGGSAGGYTTLCALTFRNLFKAGASHYGVSDLEALARDTHKFESRYLDSLIGPYPEAQALYAARSPVHHTSALSCPVIFFQGLEDRVVPPNQAEAMVEALNRRGLPVAYLAFEGEHHGFRIAANIKRVYEAELYFYAQVFGFELAEQVEPVEIKNLQ